MSYLYVDGCSFTWGLELDNPPEENWGYFLGKKLNLPVKNKSYNGQGNEEMFRKLFEVLYLKDDLPSTIVIQLTLPTRIRIYNDSIKTWEAVGVGANWEFQKDGMVTKEAEDFYFKYFYSDYERLYNTFRQLLFFKDKCDSLGIKFYFFDGIYDFMKETERINNSANKDVLGDIYQIIVEKKFCLYDGVFSWNDINNGDRKEFRDQFNLFWEGREFKPSPDEFFCSDDHPTKESHKFMANELYEFMKNG